ncbi:carbohydrate kinase family protein [Streptomyces massasporeus]|uniref:Carbohydrate kinase family protein n=1 Tax=Streptomyces massasporeus TaxID=67324 RepID=A0ABW6LT90_9ACTN
MTFQGRFSDQLLPDQLGHVSLSFLAETLEIRRGGVAANIAFGLGRLGLEPLLVGAVGEDFTDYRTWLDSHGVDTASVRVSKQHTSRFVCTTDVEQNQIATFYAGAMSEARHINIASVIERVKGPVLVLVGPNDPQAMCRHTDDCRRLGVAFAADPSQQLPSLSEDQARLLVAGARFLFTNEYEAALLQQRTGWSEWQILQQVRTWVTTRGSQGVVIAESGLPKLEVPAVPTDTVRDPTGSGDAFRAGFLAGVAWGWRYERAAQLGCATASTVLESFGTQNDMLDATDLTERVREVYGDSYATRHNGSR